VMILGSSGTSAGYQPVRLLPSRVCENAKRKEMT